MHQSWLRNRLLRHIPNKRFMMARLGGVLGLLNLLELIAAHSQPAVVVLTYHRIAVPGDPAQPYYDSVISATPESFRAQVQLLVRRFRTLTLDELLWLWAGDRADKYSQKPAVLITFDDGYRDNLEVALPILESCRASATFFIPTRFLEEPGLPWWDHVAYVLKTTNVSTFWLERFEGDRQPLRVECGTCRDADGRVSAIGTIIKHFLDGSIADHSWFLDQLNSAARVAVDTQAAGRELFMGREEVRQLCRAGMSIGSHGHSHLALGKLDEVAQRAELTTSRALLEKIIGKEVSALAYPFGWNLTYSARTRELAREAGYQLAFSSVEGINTLSSMRREPMDLRRLNVGMGDSALLVRARVLSYVTLGCSPF